ncbi:MAG: helix-hairpin-helix domain-containing protein [Dehalococcoidia bacterium]|nr:helix-hairpin-helix domain-containing protein [Dehalococcoidia bacterium]
MAGLWERYSTPVMAALAAPLLVALGFLLGRHTTNAPPLELAPSDVRVYVVGSVRQPGVYALWEGARWMDALEAAGGPTEDADLEAVNLARRVRDEDLIVIPRRGQEGRSALVNINTASARELEALPGIGPVRAEAIVRSRQEEGPFQSIDDLVTRMLIPRSVLEDIKDKVTVGP